ncbi:MAG: hypothetical protein FJ276_23465 [Planctomycetes bacterium]|nr:hypothetical protein [Planctomycetota bacterium]
MNANLRPVAQPNTSVVWTVLALGLGVFVCGAALMGLALLYQREQLWQVGLPMVLGGQLAVLAVVIWQLESVWQSNRATFVALHALDEQLRDIRRETRESGPSASLCERTDQEADCRGAPPDGDRS